MQIYKDGVLQDNSGGVLPVGSVSITEVDFVDTDGALTANSDSKVASQKATKTAIDAIIAATNAMVYKGVIDCSANPNYPAANAGDTYIVSVAGKIGGASGTNVEVGDIIICKTDSTSSGTQAGVGANWNTVQVNIDGAVVGPASSTADHFITFDGTTGKLVKDSGFSLDIDGVLTANSDTKIPSQKAVKTYADAKVSNAITNGVTTIAPSEDVVFDALALKRNWAPDRLDKIFEKADFDSGSVSTVIPWVGQALASGTVATSTTLSDGNHVGVNTISSAVGLNSGYSYHTGTTHFLVAGGEKTQWVMQVHDIIDTVIYVGFQDVSGSSSESVDGVYIQIINGVATGRTASNSSRNSTASTYNLTANTWYTFEISINAAANLATFTIYSAAGAVLWTDTQSATIPTGAGRNTGCGMTATTSGVLGPKTLCSIDYCNFYVDRTLVR